MDNTLLIFKKLATANTRSKALPFLRKIENMLSTSPNEVAEHIRVLLTPTVLMSIRSIDTEFSSEFFEFDVFAYDDSGAKHITLFIAAVQNNEKYQDDFERKIMDTITKHIKTMRLETIINDINVNNLQQVNGERVLHDAATKIEDAKYGFGESSRT